MDQKSRVKFKIMSLKVKGPMDYVPELVSRLCLCQEVPLLFSMYFSTETSFQFVRYSYYVQSIVLFWEVRWCGRWGLHSVITFNGNSSDFSQRKLGSPTIDVLFNGNVVNYTIKIGSLEQTAQSLHFSKDVSMLKDAF